MTVACGEAAGGKLLVTQAKNFEIVHSINSTG